MEVVGEILGFITGNLQGWTLSKLEVESSSGRAK